MDDEGGERDRSSGPIDAIVVRGARVHNLRDVDLDIPRDRLVVLTGVSGSGKSSLAFDTLYAEGQRRYIESLSVYARQFLDQLERPEVDLIDGLPPTVSIDQKTGQASPRSTVATVTEIHDYLRLLHARAGQPHCPICGLPIRRQTPEQIVAAVLALGEARKVIVMAPLVRGRKGQHAEAFEAIRRAGLLRARVDGQIVEIQDAPKLARTKNHDVEAVVDRLVIREGIRPRLAESIDRALQLGDGAVLLSLQTPDGGWEDRTLSTRFGCPDCGTGMSEFEPRTFSFNSPHGACPACQGLGTIATFDRDLLLADRKRSLASAGLPFRGALRPAEAADLDRQLDGFLKSHKLTRKTPLARFPQAVLDGLIDGESGFPGLRPFLNALVANAKEAQREALAEFREVSPCPACHGARLRPEARAVTVAGRALHEVSALPIAEAIPHFASLRFDPPLDAVGPPLVGEILNRLGYLERVGLGYLTLDRGADTLSGGELQRVRLATQIGSGLVGAAFILDEPTAGLHPRDTDRLIAALRDLRDAGNSVLVVEHDEATIRAADWVIDLGPGAGPDGGRIVAQGPPAELDGVDSLTASYLKRPPAVEEASPSPGPRSSEARDWLVIQGATEHNLRGDTARVPLGTITCVTGVSGSGKSTLVLDVLARAVHRLLQGTGPRPGAHQSITGLESIDKLITIDQSSIGRTPRSTPATYTGVFDEIRKVFAHTREARVRGWKASRFSFNVKGGRCEACQGQGQRRITMQFLPDLFVRCEQCAGKRFNQATLEARFKGRSISDVLELRVDAALALFASVPKVQRPLEALREAGLGYVTLGQASTTLSGGESQRVKLAAELGRIATGRTLYVLDEPTTGLHFADVARLLTVFQHLAELGNTLVIIEHNLDVIRAADWVIDLGPGGGPSGGRVLAMGPPAVIAATSESHTGAFLGKMLNHA